VGDDNDFTDGVDTDSGVLEPDESLDDAGVDDVLDEGYSPPERPLAVNDWGVTANEVGGHESLDARLRRELPDGGSSDGDGLGDTSDTDGELYDDEVGTDRAGRLAEYDGAPDDYYATDVGFDGGAASAEEAAVHVVPDDTDRY
jgi:hypothetical protein